MLLKGLNQLARQPALKVISGDGDHPVFEEPLKSRFDQIKPNSHIV